LGIKRDTSRIWPTHIYIANNVHKFRYEFAKQRASGKILDAACGAGYGSAILSDVGEVTGVDIEHAAIEWAEMHFPGPTYIKADITNEPFTGEFDYIASFETLEHLKEPEKMLRWFRKILKGRLFVSSPNEEFCKFIAEDFLNDKYPHHRHYTPKELEDLLNSEGFKVVGAFNQKDKREAEVRPGPDGRYMLFECE